LRTNYLVLRMYKSLPAAGPSFLVHIAIIVAAALTLPVVKLIEKARHTA